MLHVFAGCPRRGAFDDAGAALGVRVDEIDTLRGGDAHDVRRLGLQEELLGAVAAGRYEVVWIGMPCSSFSLWWLDKSMKRLRGRSQPEGLLGLPAKERNYLRKHNALADFSARLASAAFVAGKTFIIENPPDRGRRGSPLFRWSARHHVPLWLMPSIRALTCQCSPIWVTFAQCSLGGDFKKITTLMTAGPRARQLRGLNGLRCVHGKGEHARVAGGRDAQGRSEAAASGAYPVGMTAFCAWALLRPGAAEGGSIPPDPGVCGGEKLQVLLESITKEVDKNVAAAGGFMEGRCEEGDDRSEGAEVEMRQRRSWRSAPELMPMAWVEREDARGQQWATRATEKLRFISRRRAEPEGAEALARRPMPAAHVAPRLQKHPDRPHSGWPAGAPPRPLHVSQLYLPGVYDEILEETGLHQQDMERAEEAARKGERAPTVRKRRQRVWRAEAAQPKWAQGIVWDCGDPQDCVPMRPFDADDPADHQISARFFRDWGARLEWPDEDMLHQVTVTGTDSRSECGMDTVVIGHHVGLRENYVHARAPVEADTERGWVTRGRRHLHTVPTRLVPKNVVAQKKWKLIDSELRQVVKWRVTTDDSLEVDGVVARNDGIDRSTWGDAGLGSVQTLAEAIAVVRSHAQAMGMLASATCYERIALWALDLSDAYRELAVQRAEWHLQAYVWFDGVRLDKRAVFGSAHLPGLFQRVSSFVLAVAAIRVRAYDAQHPYSEARQAWTRCRREEGAGDGCTMSMIYLDDASGMSVLGADEPLRGAASKARPVTTSVTVDPDGRVRVAAFGDMSRGEVHLAIMRATFQEAGWRVAVEKVQYGLTIDLLGLGITTAGEGAIFVPEVKRLGMIAEVEHCLKPAEGLVERADLDRLVGRASHIGQVAPEANAYLQPMYRMLHAKVAKKRATKDGMIVKVKPRRIKVCGLGKTQRNFKEALEWLRAALHDEVSVPLAPRLQFPAPGEPGCAFLFTDAAREAGTGFGAFTVVQWGRDEKAELIYLEKLWEEEIKQALQNNVISMPGGEAFGAAAMADALLTDLEDATHMVVYTDSAATEAAINSANSPSPQMNAIVKWLFERWPGVQFLGVWQKGIRNDVADRISRGKLSSVIAEAEAGGLATRRIEPSDSACALLLEVWHETQSR
jgi:hypothetical protein